jgi:hypothetical protein
LVASRRRRNKRSDPDCLPIAGEAQQELLAMAAMRDVPDLPGNSMTMGARHQPSSMTPILSPKYHS